jgi:plastocyanin
MTTHNRQTTKNVWRLFTMMGLLIGFLTLLALEQMVQPALAAPAPGGAAVEQHSAMVLGNASRNTVSQQTAATTENVGVAKVSIANFTFTPAQVTIAPGMTVTWTNDDGAPHGLEYQDGAKGTDLLLPGASFSRQFDRPGTYDYNCSVHPYMTGRVVVRAQ